MALIVIPRRVPWRRQPPTGQRPAQALDYLLNPALEITIDSSGNRRHPDYVTGVDRRLVTPFGRGVEFTGSAERLRWVAADTAFQRIQNFTRSLLFYSVSGGTLPDGAYLWDVDIVRAGIGIGLDALAASTLGAVYYDGSVFRVLSSGVSSLTAGELHLIQFAKRKAVGHYLYFDGELVASDAVTTDVTYQSDRGAAIGSRFDGVSAPVSDIGVIGAHQRNYAISEAEAQSDWDNFWRIYSRTQRIFIPVGGTKTATFVLNDKDSAAVANATGIRAAWFDQMPGSSMAAPTDVSAIETSDGSGNHTINIPNSTLTSGQTGYYAISNSDGTIATNHLQGGGPAKVD